MLRELPDWALTAICLLCVMGLAIGVVMTLRSTTLITRIGWAVFGCWYIVGLAACWVTLLSRRLDSTTEADANCPHCTRTYSTAAQLEIHIHRRH